MTERSDRLDITALVLAGGESRRIGQSKATLPFNDCTLIGTVLAILGPLFSNILVIGREKEGLEGMGVEVLVDDSAQRGPLVGLARGLAAASTPWCFIVGCDMPFLQPEVIRQMAKRLEGCDILAVRLDGKLQPLHAFYSRVCLSKARELLDKGDTSLRSLFRHCRVQTMDSSDFPDADPVFLSLRDIDTMEDYRGALKPFRNTRNP